MNGGSKAKKKEKKKLTRDQNHKSKKIETTKTKGNILEKKKTGLE